MKRHIQNLEKNIDKSVDLYDAGAVYKAMDQHQHYLMLCSHKLASEKCQQAVQSLQILKKANTAHDKFQYELLKMSMIHSDLGRERSSSGALKILSDYLNNTFKSTEKE